MVLGDVEDVGGVAGVDEVEVEIDRLVCVVVVVGLPEEEEEEEDVDAEPLLVFVVAVVLAVVVDMASVFVALLLALVSALIVELSSLPPLLFPPAAFGHNLVVPSPLKNNPMSVFGKALVCRHFSSRSFVIASSIAMQSSEQPPLLLPILPFPPPPLPSFPAPAKSLAEQPCRGVL